MQIADSQKLLADNQQMIALLDQQAVSRSKLVNLAAEETVLQQKYTSAQAAQQDKLAAKKFSGADELHQAKELYAQLTQAQRNYIAALKNKDAVSQSYWAQNIQQASGELRALEQKLGSLNIEEGTRRKILALIQQAKDAEQSHARNVDNLNATATNLDKTLDRIGTRLLQMAATMVVLRG